MSKPTIHFVFSVPRSGNIFRRALYKVISILYITPLHRYGIDALIPWPKPKRSIHAISYNLLQAFKAKGYRVRLYSLYEHTVAKIKPEDIFIGLPLPSGGMGMTRSETDDKYSVTSRTVREYSKNKNFIIMPYAPDPIYANWTKQLLMENAAQGGGAIFIGGLIWERRWKNSPYADIPNLKKTHAIMAIDSSDYPFLKKSFNPPGKRKYLYIGHTAWYKNIKELEKLAGTIPGFHGLHIGEGRIKGWKNIGFKDLKPDFVSDLAKEYDIFLSTSISDPGATTILEQMCFGFAIASTPETGFEYPSIVPLSTNNTKENMKLLTKLQYAPETELLEMARRNREIVETKHTWKQFSKTVTDFMGI